MSVLVNQIRRGFYLDSIALMRLSHQLLSMPAISNAALMIGSPTNQRILDDAGLLNEQGRGADINDLIIAVQAESETAATAALTQVDALLEQPASAATGSSDWRPRSLQTAVKQLPNANLALISVPGEFAVAEAHKALQQNLHVMIFSDNVSIADECTLKQEANKRGLLVMGPDCGTAIINGVPLAFANAVPRGEIGIVAASGTGLQEVSCLIARNGKGVSHGIGVGGRDLSDAVGGLSTLAAIEALDHDATTRHIVLISKPPGQAVAQQILERVGQSDKPFTICFLGAEKLELPANASFAPTLQAAAEHALDVVLIGPTMPDLKPITGQGLSWIRGLYSGGTLCAEAQLILRSLDQPLYSNAPVPGVEFLQEGAVGHSLIDLGADEYTVGRPHPMLDPVVRSEVLKQTLRDPEVAVILLDVVLGFGAHENPAASVAELVADCAEPPLVIASVCGTEADPQGYSRQVEILRQAGVIVTGSNAQAAELALRAIA